jgi:hypothetical protein
MSDEENKGSRDNTSPEPKPANTAKQNAAPSGHIGTQKIQQSLGLGSVVKIYDVSFKIEVDHQEPSIEQVPEPEDTRPIALKTGVEAIDTQSEEDGQRLLSREEIKALTADQESTAPDNGSENFPDDDGTTLTPKTNDPDVNAHLEGLGHNLTTSQAEMQGQEAGGDAPDVAAEFSEVSSYDSPFGSKGDLEKAFNQVKGKEVVRTQTKGPEPS